ncbi:nucleotide exchange factor GrpE [Pokkaliibacter sp. CJK22405]|uniref:nucleotide exchange factor GrpE n=1 Tax=Pokkaliibacter sp. CJK22405 TaxID=3384615 RepID=UPI0039854AA4
MAQNETPAQDQNAPVAEELETAQGGVEPEVISEPSAEDEIAALQAAVAEAKDQTVRAHAEMQNIRRRAEQDVEKAHRYALEKFAGELLPVVDNLERAIAAYGDDEHQKAVREGVEMTLDLFVNTLKKFQVEQVAPQGEGFNPELHQAVSMVPHPEIAANKVVDVMMKGYTLNGRLLRPAMVVVSQGKD